MALFFSFSIAGAFLPLILQAKGVDTQQSQAETYRSYVWICKCSYSGRAHLESTKVQDES